MPTSEARQRAAQTDADKARLRDEREFKQRLCGVIPHLRAFGYSLCGRMDLTDDLVQETLLKAWAARARFKPETSLRAWTFVILRNSYISILRRNKFSAPYDAGVAERSLAAPADQHGPIELEDVRRAMLQLNQDQREALILIGAGGFSYEEAAEICGCAVGTMKSRVSRARANLEALLAESGTALDNKAGSASDAFDSIIGAIGSIAGDQMPMAA